jgi:hypothetical protein
MKRDRSCSLHDIEREGFARGEKRENRKRKGILVILPDERGVGGITALVLRAWVRFYQGSSTEEVCSHLLIMKMYSRRC